MKLVVGNRVTYKYKKDGEYYTEIITDMLKIKEFQTNIATGIYEDIKVEACNWEEIEFEEKELLTKEEKNFLNKYNKFSNIRITGILKEDNILNFMYFDAKTSYLEIYKAFEGLEDNRYYTLEELGLEK